MKRVTQGAIGLALGAMIWGALAAPASAVYQALYEVNERCYAESLNELLETGSGDAASGCISPIVFVVTGAAMNGPMILLVSAESSRSAPVLSGLIFAAIGGLSGSLLGVRRGLLATAVMLFFVEAVLAGFMLVLWELA